MQALESEYPEAYKALPEPYQADSCLEFCIDGLELLAYAAQGQEQAIGETVWHFDFDQLVWECWA